MIKAVSTLILEQKAELALCNIAIDLARLIQSQQERFIANRLPTLILLNGDLGAGKTTFSRAFIQALVGEVLVKSPTYEIFTNYQAGTVSIYHSDFYRLDHVESLEQIGWFETFNAGTIQLVEWPSQVPFWINCERIEIEIETLPLNHRTIQLTSFYNNQVFNLNQLRNEKI